MNHQTKSQTLYRRAKQIILGGNQTISKQPERYDAEYFPAYIERGAGARLWDIDGNCYVDFIAALGPVILGYCHPPVDEAVREQLSKGVLFSSNSPLEVELAEKLIKIIPNAEKVRFFKSGAEATSAAVRLARGFTGREKIVSCGYQGWHDWWVAKNAEAGIPRVLCDLTIDLPYGDISAAEEILNRCRNEIACVIVEPVAGRADGEFLEKLAALTRSAGALLIFDEIITGFRLALGGAQEFFGINADLAVFGKAMANGFPLSAIAGRRDVFDAAEDLWISSTYGGETLSLAAALATLKELENRLYYPHAKKLGEKLLAGLDEILTNFPAVNAQTAGISELPALGFALDAKAQEDVFMREMIKQGFLTRRNHYWFISAAHTEEDIERALDACRNAFAQIPQNILEGGRKTLSFS